MNSFGARFIRRSDAVSDYDTYKASGIPAIDISFYENRRFFQTPDDSLDRIQPKHVQYLGSNALGLVNKLKDADWINSLEINAYTSPFYDHFGGTSGIIFTPLKRGAIVIVLLLGLISLHVTKILDLTELSKQSPIQTLLNYTSYEATSLVLGYFLAHVFASVAFSTQEEIQGWTAAPLAVLGSAFAA
ncbi:hypothetical protein HDU99_007063, partial [Rhizoclosmatium hyalinum]